VLVGDIHDDQYYCCAQFDSQLVGSILAVAGSDDLMAILGKCTYHFGTEVRYCSSNLYNYNICNLYCKLVCCSAFVATRQGGVSPIWAINLM